MNDRSPYSLVTRDPEKGEPSLNDEERVKRLVFGGATFVFVASICGLGFVWLQVNIDDSLTAEAPNVIGQIAKYQVQAYAAGRTEPVHHGVVGPSLCKSAPHPVPKSVGEVKGHSYQSYPGEWQEGAEDEGFRCLRFEIAEPQTNQYYFASTGPQGSFTVTAHGDRDGDGVTSTFSLSGRVDPTRRGVILDTSIHEVRPKE
jgi:hypothetical protein